MNTRTIMIMAGGTGGHVIPALAVAHELRQQGFRTIWLGTKQGIEARLVPAAGIDIEWIPVSGLRGKGKLALLLAPFRLLRAIWTANSAFRRHRPSAALGMGGFASGPGGLVAWLRRVPLVLHEQNSIAGMTNRILARFTKHVLAAFPSAFPDLPNAKVVGNPVREEVAALPVPLERIGDRGDFVNILVLGGSQGAASLNRILPASLSGMSEGIAVRHQCGRVDVEAIRNDYARHGINASVEVFIDDMAAAYAWADLVICRSGAMTVFEIAAAGIAAIFVPFPHAVDNHQASNAAWLVDAGAARMIPESELTPESLSTAIGEVATRSVLLDMAGRARARAMPQATHEVAAYCAALAGGVA